MRLILLAAFACVLSGQTLLQQNYDPRSYQFTRTNGAGASGDLTSAGASKTITLTPCPRSAVTNYAYLSGGTGTAEAAAVTGGTCTSSASSGTVVVTTAYAHSGAWAVTSASSGIREAVSAMPAAGGRVNIPDGTSLLYAPLIIDKSVVMQGSGAGSILKLADGTNPAGATISAGTTGTVVTFIDLMFDGNRANNTTTGTAFLQCTYARCNVTRNTFKNANANSAVRFQDSTHGTVSFNYFENNRVHAISLNQTVQAGTYHTVIGNTFEFSSFTVSGCTNATPIACTTTAAHNLVTGQNVSISGASVAAINYQWDVVVTGPTTFTLTTSTASGVSTGGTAYEGNFSLATVGQRFISVVGNTSLKGGEGFQFNCVTNSVMAGNTSHLSRDSGFTLTTDGSCVAVDGNSITGNTSTSSFFEGFYCGPACTYNVFSGNTAKSSGASGVADRMSGIQIFNSDTAGNLITGNRFAGNPEYGINVRASASQTRVIGNALDANSLGEIKTDGTDIGTSYASEKGGAAWAFGCSGTATSSATLHLSVTPPGACTNTTEGNSQFVLVNKAGLIRNLQVRFGSNAVANTVVTVRLNAATSTTLTCTVLATSNTCSDVTHSAAVVLGDVLAVRVVTGAAETLSGIQVSFDN